MSQLHRALTGLHQCSMDALKMEVQSTEAFHVRDIVSAVLDTFEGRIADVPRGKHSTMYVVFETGFDVNFPSCFRVACMP